MTTTIIRAPRRQRFLVVDQRVVEDERLSWAARGVVCYLLSRPGNWKVLPKDLQKRGDLGRDGIYRVLRELLKVGYAEYHQIRDAQGRIRGGVYIIHEARLSPHPDLPHAVGPEAEPPDSARPEALPNTERNKERTTSTRQTTTHNGDHCHSSSQPPVEIPAWVAKELRQPARQQVAALDPPVAQTVIDEWAVLLELGAIHRSPIGYLRSLVMRAQAGAFHPKYAEDMAMLRDHEENR